MYIQPSEPFFVPEGYSGNAFRALQTEVQEQEPLPQTAPEQGIDEEAVKAERAANGIENGQAETVVEGGENETAEAPVVLEKEGEREKSLPTGSLLSRLPFLSSLLPPPRGRSLSAGLPEWVVLAGVILLLLGDGENADVLPFLLLLLLWD